MLAVARSLGAGFPAVDLTLLDRQALVSQAAIASYAELGWQARLVTVDVLDWTADAARVDGHITADTDWDAVVTSLFLHHFEGPQLAALLRKVAGCSRFFVACEPRRAGLALAASRLVGLIGANAVTRQDAVLSVHAGFADQELSGLWPQPHASWSLREGPAGLFSHSFEAERLSAMGHGTH